MSEERDNNLFHDKNGHHYDMRKQIKNYYKGKDIIRNNEYSVL